jgi:hypothetical protein
LFDVLLECLQARYALDYLFLFGSELFQAVPHVDEFARHVSELP